jgi:hypothetical protein
MNPNCVERRDSTVAPQALHLMNNGMIQQLTEHFAHRVIHEAGDDPTRRVERIWWIALGRPPGAQEREIAVNALRDLANTWSKHLPAGKGGQAEASRKALTTFCHTIMNSAAFLYLD